MLNLKVAAIISEYNPLHNGHIYHINRTKRETGTEAVISVMSGNFVQRGIPALIDKWKRADFALENGIDLVIELPSIYSLSSAEFFSYGAVSLIHSLGVVDTLSFGSECGDVELLLNIAKILVEEPTEFKGHIKYYLNEGLPFAVARSNALIDYIKNNDFHNDFEALKDTLNSSNNILGIEYCKSLINLNSSIKPFSIQRQGGSYNSSSLNDTFSSATSIRKYIGDKSSITGLESQLSPYVFNKIENLIKDDYNFVFEDSIIPYIRYKSFTSRGSLEKLPDVSEGIHNKIYKALEGYNSHTEIAEQIKSRRYTYTRINRILCQYFIGFEEYNTKVLRKAPCPYARVLGFNKKGAEVLKRIKNNSSIPHYTKLPKETDDVLRLELQSTKAYSLINRNVNPNSDYLISPIIK